MTHLNVYKIISIQKIKSVSVTLAYGSYSFFFNSSVPFSEQLLP